jgi:multidrug efflux pump subunit AcrB
MNEFKTQKEFGLSTLSINNRRTVFILAFIIFLAGLISYKNLPKENFPEVSIPTIYVGTPYPGNSPKVIEDQITRLLEKEISTIEGLDKLNSTSIQGYSTIIAEFDFDVESSKALQKVKDAVDKAKSDKDFPTDLPADPNVFEMNFSEFPIMNINLSGNYSIDQLKEYGEMLEDEIENLPEINKVEIRGVQEKELEIALDPNRAQAMEISLGDIENAIMRENITMSGGELLVDDFRRTIRVEGEFKSAAEVAEIIVKREKGNLVYLKDIATVGFGDKETESYAREYTKPVVMLDVVKRSGKNLLDASDKINEIVLEAKKNYLPKNLELTITNDQSIATRDQVSNLENSIIFGIILVVLVLLFFLGLRNALFVGVAIPLSMFMAFSILSAIGFTLNVMVLFALVLALGMLVDNGIVVVENIYRLMQEGYSATEAAKKGVGEVAIPIIASTATTLAVFFPLAVWPGMIGQFMKFLPFTLIIVLGSSLFVALVINPVLTAAYMKLEEKEGSSKLVLRLALAGLVVGVILNFAGLHLVANIFMFPGIITLLNIFIFKPGAKNFQQKLLPVLENKYNDFLVKALKGKNPRRLFGGTILLLIFSFILLGLFTPQVLFFPENEPNYVNVFISTPIGTDIEKTNMYTKQAEERVLEVVKRYDYTTEIDGVEHTSNKIVNSVIAQVGQGAKDPNEGPAMGTTPNKGRITVSFVEFKLRHGILSTSVLEEIRENLKDRFPADVQITVAKNSAGPPTQPPINIEVQGKDYEQIVQLAGEIRNYISRAAIPGVEELKLDVEIGKPELPIIIDREKVRAFNLSTYQVADQIRTALFGKEISTFKSGDDDYAINLRYDTKYRYDLESLLNQKITFRDAATGKIAQVPISSLIEEPKQSSTYSAVKRKDQTRLITVVSNVLEGYNPNEVVDEVKNHLKGFNAAIPQGYSYEFTGQQEEQAKEMAFLSKALLIAVFLIFLILVSQFNSSSTPAVIVTAVGLSLIGVLLGLVIFQMDFVIIMTMIGIISLAGIVVNNAIVLIDYTNLIMERKRRELSLANDERLPMPVIVESIVEGGKTRLRPVLLTAITTVLGLIPLAMGINIDFFGLITNLDPNLYMGGDNVMFFGPMSWTIIFGLSFATFLTLVIVPVMYLILNKIKFRFNLK